MISTAELTWALVLTLVRHLPAEMTSFRQGGWQVSMGGDLHGKTLGVIGLGYSGSRVARYGQAFGMRVIAWSQNMTPESAARHDAILVSKDGFFNDSDKLQRLSTGNSAYVLAAYSCATNSSAFTLACLNTPDSVPIFS